MSGGTGESGSGARRSRERVEDVSYTDVAVDTGFEAGPLKVMSASGSGNGDVELGVILRSELHDVDLSSPDYSRTSAGSFHGGDLSDEVAALLALGLGARFDLEG